MLGIDIIKIDRIQLRESFITLILTPEEQEELLLRHTDASKKEYIAGRFAVKEAIFKATQDPDYLKFACLNDIGGRPYILDHPEIDVSIAHDAGIAEAVVQVSSF